MMKPTNVLVNPTIGQVRHMGFGIASRILRALQAHEAPDFIAGPYMALETRTRAPSRRVARIFDSIPSLVHTGQA
jgi:hypothetical protein